MRQSRICEHLGLKCTHLRSFLCLPPAIRLRIYSLAGLVEDIDIDLNQRPGTDSWPWPFTDDFHFTFNLLLTCRTIYTEASFIVYNTNRFFIRYRDSQSLQALRNLTPNSLSSLSYLTVHLNITSCSIGEPCSNVQPAKARARHRYDKTLQSSSRSSQKTLREWQSTARYVIAHVQPFNFRLHLVCDVEDLEAAELAVEPLSSTQTLLDCALRLCRQPDPLIQELARKTATRAMGRCLDQIESPFRFLALPPELRCQVLEYTDLVTPLREVEWNPEKGYYLRYSTSGCEGSWFCPSDLHRACRFRNCWDCSNTGCFCSLSHAAFSSKCHCWSPPTSLFFVCRVLLEDVQNVFFKRNRFVITPSAGCNRPADKTPNRLEISAFLTDVVPSNALRFLRFLEVVIPPFEEDYLRPHEPAYQDWLQTIDCIGEQLCLPMLTVRVYMAEYLPRGGESSPFRAKMTKEQGTTILKMYARTLGHLSKLRGLRRFFVHLAWPFRWTRAGRHRYRHDPESVQKWIRVSEQGMERFVMGDGYDCSPLEKERLGNSQWLEVALAATEYGE